jgi:hypothetical protein
MSNNEMWRLLQLWFRYQILRRLILHHRQALRLFRSAGVHNRPYPDLLDGTAHSLVLTKLNLFPWTKSELH